MSGNYCPTHARTMTKTFRISSFGGVGIIRASAHCALFAWQRIKFLFLVLPKLGLRISLALVYGESIFWHHHSCLPTIHCPHRHQSDFSRFMAPQVWTSRGSSLNNVQLSPRRVFGTSLRFAQLLPHRPFFCLCNMPTSPPARIVCPSTELPSSRLLRVHLGLSSTLASLKVLK